MSPQPGSMIGPRSCGTTFGKSAMWRSHSGGFDDRISVAGDVERRYSDRYAVKRREQFPIPVNVAVPIEPAAEPGADKFAGVIVYIGLGQPGGQRRRHSGARANRPPCSGTFPKGWDSRGASPEILIRPIRNDVRTLWSRQQ
jgi:hypothetical protein